MKAISDTIFTWFMIRGIIDAKINNSSIKEVKFVSPSNKLKEFDTNIINEADKSKKYSITKKLSIINTKIILTSYNLNEWIDRFLLFTKKDDLADSFLQGWYILNNLFLNKLYDQYLILNISNESLNNSLNDTLNNSLNNSLNDSLTKIKKKSKIKKLNKIKCIL